jgi:hypothetical protein
VAAAGIVTDPVRLRRLCHDVETKDLGAGEPGLVRPDLAAALALTSGLAEEIEATGSPRDNGSVQQAHLRLVVAALHYLVTEQDVIPDDHLGGLLDDRAILAWVFRAAHDELAPYLHLDADG